MNSSIETENLQEFYSRNLEYYDELFPVEEAQYGFISRLQQAFNAASLVQPPPICRFLGLGCATGTLENKLVNSGFDTTGIDKNADMIETAKRRMKRGYSTGRFFEMSTIDIARFLKAGSFNIIFCPGDLLWYIPDETLIRKFLHDCRGLLAPGGTLVIQTQNFESKDLSHAFRLPERSSVRVTLSRSLEPSEDGLLGLNASLEQGNGQTIILKKGTKLLPLNGSAIEDFARKAGFTEVKRFGSFDETEWSPDSPETILVFR